MFNALELHNLLNVQTFKPFRIHMSDGTAYDVFHHDSAIVCRNYVAVGTDLDTNRIPGTITRYDLLHITQIEVMQRA